MLKKLKIGIILYFLVQINLEVNMFAFMELKYQREVLLRKSILI